MGDNGWILTNHIFETSKFMQETSLNYVPMLIYELLLDFLFNFVEKYMKQLVLIDVFDPISKNGFAPWKRNTEMTKTVQ